MDRNRILILAVVVLLLVALFCAGGMYVGGLAFVRLEKLPDSAVGFFTLRDYWRAYGDVHQVKRVLVLCNAIAVLITAIPVVIAGLAVATLGRRALHGDARFARDSEIRRAGLVGD
ncbi:hypothetical protein [Paraburkholderia flagellata]|uniref:hypothetical protein n=1 Tax=Paraburkholderia flagellata TaxID=2883241 RepID=UPI001F364E50|nr:hypothetical protein [Paraburkholderia flagellata]